MKRIECRCGECEAGTYHVAVARPSGQHIYHRGDTNACTMDRCAGGSGVSLCWEDLDGRLGTGDVVIVESAS